MAAKKSVSGRLASFDMEYLGGRPYIVGVDEAGRGCLAGPVCACALAVKAGAYSNAGFISALADLDDSKRLSPSSREALYGRLADLKARGAIDFEAAFAGVGEIEKYNILGATKLAMERAVGALNLRLSLNLARSGAAATLFGEGDLDLSRANLLIDGNPLKKFPFAHLAIVGGDAQSLAIAAASVVAKVSRDKYMVSLAEKYPEYGFEEHKGYGTPRHLQALLLRGPCPEHRRDFLKKFRGAPGGGAKQAELF